MSTTPPDGVCWSDSYFWIEDKEDIKNEINGDRDEVDGDKDNIAVDKLSHIQ